MKTKQIVGILITGAVIIVVGVSGVVSNVVKNKMTTQRTDNMVNSLVSGKSVTLPKKDFVGVINIVGEIKPSDNDIWGSDGKYDHDLYMKYIDQMKEDTFNKGILLYVDSPGGTVYESDELYLKLMEYKEQTGRPIWAYFATQACSGGYYISMASDKIYANRNCWTGSIGVIISLANYKGLYDKLGIKEIDITSGPNKAMGSGGLDMTQEQRDILQSLVDEAYDQFVGIVSTGRGMDEKKVRNLADGRIYSALQAKDNALVDEIGSYEEEKKIFLQENGLNSDTQFFTPDTGVGSFMSSLFGAADKVKTKSEAEVVKEIIDSEGKGVLKYYAE
ncbi:MAG: signal peptide peptidase SppA [Lachnospiraceae bacterium]|nr:signal peptide peptidase SppA [Lachnospiraceae bacterium]